MIENCKFSGTEIGGTQNGGISVYNEKIISNCHSTSDLIGEYVGGICYYNKGEILNFGDSGVTNYYGGIITNCYFCGNIYSKYSGGITKLNRYEINNSYLIGDIKAEFSAGISYESIPDHVCSYKLDYDGSVEENCHYLPTYIFNCYMKGNIYNNRSSGIVREADEESNIYNCYFFGDITSVEGSSLVDTLRKYSNLENSYSCGTSKLQYYQNDGNTTIKNLQKSDLWDDILASEALEKTDDSVWISFSPNTPFQLISNIQS